MKKLFVFASAVLMAAAVNADVNINAADFTINGDPDYVEAAEDAGVVTVNYDLGEWAAGGLEYALEAGLAITGVDLEAKLEGTCDESQWLAFMVALQDEEGVNWYNPTPDMHLNDARFADFYSIEQYTSDEAGVPTLYMPTTELWTSQATWACGEKPFTKLIIMANPMVAEVNSFSVKNIVIRTQATGLSEVAAKAEAKKVMKDGKLFIQVNGREFTAAGMAL